MNQNTTQFVRCCYFKLATCFGPCSGPSSGHKSIYSIKLYSISHKIYLLTPWCRVPLEQLTGLQLVKKFPAFHGTRRFITALTSVRHLSLSWANPIQSTYPHPTSWRSILILPPIYAQASPVVSFPPASPPRPYTLPFPPHTRHIPSSSHSSRFDHPHNIG